MEFSKAFEQDEREYMMFVAGGKSFVCALPLARRAAQDGICTDIMQQTLRTNAYLAGYQNRSITEAQVHEVLEAAVAKLQSDARIAEVEARVADSFSAVELIAASREVVELLNNPVPAVIPANSQAGSDFDIHNPETETLVSTADPSGWTGEQFYPSGELPERFLKVLQAAGRTEKLYGRVSLSHSTGRALVVDYRTDTEIEVSLP